MKNLARKWIHTILRAPVESFIKKYSLVGDHDFFEPYDFAWIKELEANWQHIRYEAIQLQLRNQIPSETDLFPMDTELAEQTEWQTYFLYAFGHKINANCARCPETVRLLQAIPNMRTAVFSVIKAGRSLPEHRGFFNAVLRYHLALIVPEPAQSCGLKVNGKIRYWQEGQSLVFDDSYPHEAWNSAEKDRIVLLVDFIRPLPKKLHVCISALYKLLAKSRHARYAIKQMENYQSKQQAAN